MNMIALGQLLAKYPKLLGLTDMKDLRANQLRSQDVQRIADAFNVTVPFTDELVGAFLELLKGREINSVADMIQDQQSVVDVVTFLTSGYRGLVEIKAAQAAETSANQIAIVNDHIGSDSATAADGESSLLFIS